MNSNKILSFFLSAIFSGLILSFHAQIQTKLPCIDKRFSIVAHVVKDSLGNTSISDQVINDNVNSLNAVFAKICISFEVCDIRYIDNFRYNKLYSNKGHWAHLQQEYNQQNVINIYYVDSIIDPLDAAGFAGLGAICNLQSNGIVLTKYSSFGSRVISHEMGHYFGLIHTFENSSIKEELVNGSNCKTSGDLICDTPADPYENVFEYLVDGNCKFISTKRDNNNQFYDPIVGNIMSYYSSKCDCGFTHDQYMRMANTYFTNPKMW